jgi:hypothetical protein
MALMTDPMIVARGIITLVSETVADEDLEIARETLDVGYPLSAIFSALAAARDHGGWVNEDVRDIVYNQIEWPEDELEDINVVLRDTPLKAA